MHSIFEIIGNHAVICGLIAWFTAQLLKVPLYWRVEHKLDWKRFFGAGGMPSSHSAMVCAVTVMVGAMAGFDTPVFAVAVALSCVVMYDATGVRRETGRQSVIINEILEKVFVDGAPISDDELRELIGHSPFEVFAGALLGILIACVYLMLL